MLEGNDSSADRKEILDLDIIEFEKKVNNYFNCAKLLSKLENMLDRWIYSRKYVDFMHVCYLNDLAKDLLNENLFEHITRSSKDRWNEEVLIKLVTEHKDKVEIWVKKYEKCFKD